MTPTATVERRGASSSYTKGRGVAGDKGVLTAAFDGDHGWFWRNRGSARDREAHRDGRVRQPEAGEIARPCLVTGGVTMSDPASVSLGSAPFRPESPGASCCRSRPILSPARNRVDVGTSGAGGAGGHAEPRG